MRGPSILFPGNQIAEFVSSVFVLNIKRDVCNDFPSRDVFGAVSRTRPFLWPKISKTPVSIETRCWRDGPAQFSPL